MRSILLTIFTILFCIFIESIKVDVEWNNRVWFRVIWDRVGNSSTYIADWNFGKSTSEKPGQKATWGMSFWHLGYRGGIRICSIFGKDLLSPKFSLTSVARKESKSYDTWNA